MTAADYPDFQTPQAHATAIAATGVPLLSLSNVIASNAAQTVTHGVIFQTGAKNIIQPSYEMSIEVKAATTPASPFIKVTLQWFDGASGALLDHDDFWVPVSSPSFGPITLLRGTSKGTQVNLQLFDGSSNPDVSVNYALLQSSRVFTRDVCHWDNQGYAPGLVPGYTLPTLPPDTTSLGLLDNATIAASSTNTYLFAPWDGLIEVVCQVNTGSAASLTTAIRPQPDSNFATHPVNFSAVGVAPNAQFVGSRSPLRVDLTNSATSAIAVTFALWAIR